MKIYTRTGDGGTTGLLAGGRVSKASARMEACGDVDELNAVLGLAACYLAAEPHSPELEQLRLLLRRLQSTLFVVGAELATAPGHRTPSVEPVGKQSIAELEQAIDNLSEKQPPPASFVLPGGTPAAAALHLARTVCRRAERAAVAVMEEEQVRAEAVTYLNRLSDLLFVMAQAANRAAGVQEALWSRKDAASE
jgi:cob(I)alamin adenosyltransferase